MESVYAECAKPTRLYAPRWHSYLPSHIQRSRME